MDIRRGFLPIAVGISLAVAPLGAAHADDSHHLAGSQGKSALDSTLGAKGPKLKKGKTVKKDPKRNTEKYTGARPYWVQLPVVVKHKGKYSIKASVSARAFKKKGAHKKSAPDRLTLTVALLKKGATVPTQNTRHGEHAKSGVRAPPRCVMHDQTSARRMVRTRSRTLRRLRNGRIGA